MKIKEIINGFEYEPERDKETHDPLIDDKDDKMRWRWGRKMSPEKRRNYPRIYFGLLCENKPLRTDEIIEKGIIKKEDGSLYSVSAYTGKLNTILDEMAEKEFIKREYIQKRKRKGEKGGWQHEANLEVIKAFIRTDAFHEEEFKRVEKEIAKTIKTKEWRAAVKKLIESDTELNFKTMILQFILKTDKNNWLESVVGINMRIPFEVETGYGGFSDSLRKELKYGYEYQEYRNISHLLKRLENWFIYNHFYKDMICKASLNKEEAEVRFACDMLGKVIEEIRNTVIAFRDNGRFCPTLIYCKPPEERKEYVKKHTREDIFESFLEYVDKTDEHVIKELLNILGNEKYSPNIYINVWSSGIEFKYNTKEKQEEVYRFADYYKGDWEEFIRHAPLTEFMDYNNEEGYTKKVHKRTESFSIDGFHPEIVAELYDYTKDIHKKGSFTEQLRNEEKTLLGFDCVIYKIIDEMIDWIEDIRWVMDESERGDITRIDSFLFDSYVCEHRLVKKGNNIIQYFRFYLVHLCSDKSLKDGWLIYGYDEMYGNPPYQNLKKILENKNNSNFKGFQAIQLFIIIKEFEGYIKKLQESPNVETFKIVLKEFKNWNDMHKKDSVLYKKCSEESDEYNDCHADKPNIWRDENFKPIINNSSDGIKHKITT